MSQRLSGELGHSGVIGVLIVGGVLIISLVLVLFHPKPHPPGTEAALSDDGVAKPTPAQSEEPGQDAAQKDPQSQEPARKVLIGLKRFQGATQSNMSYEEYDEMLTSLKSDLNNTLPTFVRQEPSDEAFRQEVAAALRDYTAAGNWWKTTIRNSSVLNDADRDERLQANWKSAQTHLDNAQNLLLH